MTSRMTVIAGSVCTGAALIALAGLTACAPTDHGVILKNLRVQLAQQYHECVPLGWDPVPVFAGAFYRGYSTEYVPDVKWLPAQWIGIVHSQDLRNPDVRASYDVLNELLRVGMVERNVMPGGFRYHLTMRALDYYFERTQYRNNPGGESYLCYSAIVPQRVLWNQPIHIEKDRDGQPIQAFRAAFEWRASPIADWASSALLRSHSVILPPLESPTIAKFVNVDGDWVIQNVSASIATLPRVTDAAVWPPLRR